MAQKSRDAFRTISEVAEWLDVPTHVLRFWESRFSQIKPVKRAGGRRYYRPSDMRIIGGVKNLLHDQGMTIRGVQKLFREEGVKHVSSFSASLNAEDAEAIDAKGTSDVIEAEAISTEPASPALTSRDAVPKPIIDPPQDAPEEEPLEDSAPLFSHRSEAPRTESRVVEATPPPEPDDATVPTQEVAEADDTAPPEGSKPDKDAPKASIPDTPDVPLTDPEDDASDFQSGPGAAARLLLASRTDLDAHSADLADAARRLKAVLDRAS